MESFAGRCEEGRGWGVVDAGEVVVVSFCIRCTLFLWDFVPVLGTFKDFGPVWGTLKDFVPVWGTLKDFFPVWGTLKDFFPVWGSFGFVLTCDEGRLLSKYEYERTEDRTKESLEGSSVFYKTQT